MRTTQPTDRILRGFLLLGIVIIASVAGYRWVFRLDWFEALWLTIISISGVGYGEESVKQPPFQLFTIGVILFGFFASAYAFTGLIQLLLEGELERTLGKRRMQREINKLRDHVVICGYGRLGNCLAADLAHEKREFVIVENDPAHVESARDGGYLVIPGDATEEDVLKDAGLVVAKSFSHIAT